MHLGTYGFAMKPIDVGDLLEKIADACKHKADKGAAERETLSCLLHRYGLTNQGDQVQNGVGLEKIGEDAIP